MSQSPTAHRPRRLSLVAGVLAFVLTACGGEGGAPSAPASVVEAVQVSAQPTGPMLVGTSVQLIATPLNATGAVVSDQRVTWSSSDPTLATVSAAGLVLALRAGSVTIDATSGGATGRAALDLRGGGTVGAGGGTLSVLDSAVTITLPVSALSQATTLLVRPVVGGIADPRMVGASAFEVGPEELALARTGTLRIRFDRSRIAANTSEPMLQLYKRAGSAWLQVRGSTVDTITHSVTGSFTGAGSYAVIATPVSRLALSGAVSDGALYAGQTASLVATSYDLNGDVLAGRTVTWTSSDAGVASVDATGKVTAVRAGTATITASVDGQAATASVSVLGAPTPSWSQATEWSTFQGDARHTGAIAATLDPRVFRQRWTSTLRGPVTLGDGKVYGIRQTSLVALDAATGTQAWAYDLGARDSYSPPAFGNDRVYLQTGGHSNSFLWAVSSGGTLQWRTAYGNQWSSWYAPTVVDQSVYVAAGYYGGMEAYDATSGQRRWTAATNQYDQWTPAVANGVAYAYTGSYSPKVSAVDATTGQVRYQIADPSFSWAGWSMNLAPVLGSQDDLIARHDSRLVSFDLAARTIRWEVKGLVGAWSGGSQVTLANGVIYTFNGNQVEARSETTGALAWVWPLPAGGTPVGTMIATNNLLFVSATQSGSTTGVTYAVDLGARRQVWSHPLSGQLAMGANGVLFIAGTNSLVAISVR